MKIGKLGIFLLMVCFIFSSMGIQVYAAVVGEHLVAPETGWKRYDNTDSSIEYGGGAEEYNYADAYNGSVIRLNSNGAYYKFNFYGTKIRVIGTDIIRYAKNVKIEIDGVVEQYDAEINKTGWKSLQYEKTGLARKEHSVKIYRDFDNVYDNGQIHIDAIDIDDDGELKPYNDNVSTAPDAPTNLTATAGDEKVDLSWDAVEGAEKYIVKRATTAEGPYTNIAEDITKTSYTDTDVKNETTYYYVVCAVKDGKESPNSNEVSATPKGSSSGDKALLRITMINGKINEYDLSMDDVEDFIEWYEDRADNRGKPYHVIEKDYNRGPFQSRKDYIAFDKILQFEVMEYND